MKRRDFNDTLQVIKEMIVMSTKTTSKILAEVLLITRAMAEEFLASQNNLRKRINRGRVKAYAREMINGRWILGPAIYLDLEGRLIDGQHRLYALLESGLESLEFHVIRVDKQAAFALDQGWIRSGDMFLTQSPDHSRSVVSVLRMIYNYDVKDTRQYAITGSLIPVLEKKYGAGARFSCCECFAATQKNITRTSVKTIWARAYYACSKDRDRLLIAAKKLYSQDFSQEDSGLRLLSRYLCGMYRVDALTVYRKTQRGLFAWLNGEKVDKLYPDRSVLFPVPALHDEEVEDA